MTKDRLKNKYVSLFCPSCKYFTPQKKDKENPDQRACLTCGTVFSLDDSNKALYERNEKRYGS